jgi:hypothetical protein
MHVILSAHARERMAERGLSEDGVRAIIDSPETMQPDPNLDRVRYVGQYAGRRWTVVVTRTPLPTVVTVYPARV